VAASADGAAGAGIGAAGIAVGMLSASLVSATVGAGANATGWLGSTLGCWMRLIANTVAIATTTSTTISEVTPANICRGEMTTVRPVAGADPVGGRSVAPLTGGAAAAGASGCCGCTAVEWLTTRADSFVPDAGIDFDIDVCGSMTARGVRSVTVATSSSDMNVAAVESAFLNSSAV